MFLSPSLSLSLVVVVIVFYIIIDEAHVYFISVNRGSLYTATTTTTKHKNTPAQKNDDVENIHRTGIITHVMTRLTAQIKITNIYAKSCQQAYNKLHKEKKSFTHSKIKVKTCHAAILTLDIHINRWMLKKGQRQTDTQTENNTCCKECLPLVLSCLEALEIYLMLPIYSNFSALPVPY